MDLVTATIVRVAVVCDLAALALAEVGVALGEITIRD